MPVEKGGRRGAERNGVTAKDRNIKSSSATAKIEMKILHLMRKVELNSPVRNVGTLSELVNRLSKVPSAQ